MSVDPWLDALHASSSRLAAAVDGLSDEELSRTSYSKDWTIAQVLSHLGSGAEIFAGLLELGIAGKTEMPGQEEFVAIWDRWNALSAPEQRAQWRESDARHLALIDSLSAEQRESVRVPFFVGPIDLLTYAGFRLSEQSVHAWDVEVALDPDAATIPAAETDLLWERLDQVASRAANADALTRLAPANVTIRRTDAPDDAAALLLDSELRFSPGKAAEPTIGSVTGPTEALLRLVYGRNRPERDGVTVVATADAVTLEDLRALFPGF